MPRGCAAAPASARLEVAPRRARLLRARHRLALHHRRIGAGVALRDLADLRGGVLTGSPSCFESPTMGSSYPVRFPG